MPSFNSFTISRGGTSSFEFFLNQTQDTFFIQVSHGPRQFRQFGHSSTSSVNSLEYWSTGIMEYWVKKL